MYEHFATFKDLYKATYMQRDANQWYKNRIEYCTDSDK